MSQSYNEALEGLADQWKRVWNRKQPDHDEVMKKVVEVLGPKRKTCEWKTLTAEQLLEEAKRQKNSSGGIDGLGGNEVSALPLEIWEVIASIFADFASIGEAPEAFRLVRQAHIPKAGKGIRKRNGKGVGKGKGQYIVIIIVVLILTVIIIVISL